MSQTFRRDGIYRHRFFWWYPWGLTRWWLPGISRGGDEWCNDSLVFVVPPLGALVLFWRPGRLRTMPCDEEWAAMDEQLRADYAYCGHLHGGRIREDAFHHNHLDVWPCDRARRWLRHPPARRSRCRTWCPRCPAPRRCR